MEENEENPKKRGGEKLGKRDTRSWKKRKEGKWGEGGVLCPEKDRTKDLVEKSVGQKKENQSSRGMKLFCQGLTAS